MEAKQWLVEWFRKRPGAERFGEAELSQVNYFEAGLLDSMGIVQLVEEAEREFGIRFEGEDFEQPDFARISGLARLIESRRKAG